MDREDAGRRRRRRPADAHGVTLQRHRAMGDPVTIAVVAERQASATAYPDLVANLQEQTLGLGRSWRRGRTRRGGACRCRPGWRVVQTLPSTYDDDMRGDVLDRDMYRAGCDHERSASQFNTPDSSSYVNTAIRLS